MVETSFAASSIARFHELPDVLRSSIYSFLHFKDLSEVACVNQSYKKDVIEAAQINTAVKSRNFIKDLQFGLNCKRFECVDARLQTLQDRLDFTKCDTLRHLQTQYSKVQSKIYSIIRGMSNQDLFDVIENLTEKKKYLTAGYLTNCINCYVNEIHLRKKYLYLIYQTLLNDRNDEALVDWFAKTRCNYIGKGVVEELSKHFFNRQMYFEAAKVLEGINEDTREELVGEICFVLIRMNLLEESETILERHNKNWPGCDEVRFSLCMSYLAKRDVFKAYQIAILVSDAKQKFKLFDEILNVRKILEKNPIQKNIIEACQRLIACGNLDDAFVKALHLDQNSQDIVLECLFIHRLFEQDLKKSQEILLHMSSLDERKDLIEEILWHNKTSELDRAILVLKLSNPNTKINFWFDYSIKFTFIKEELENFIFHQDPIIENYDNYKLVIAGLCIAGSVDLGLAHIERIENVHEKDLIYAQIFEALAKRSNYKDAIFFVKKIIDLDLKDRFLNKFARLLMSFRSLYSSLDPIALISNQKLQENLVDQLLQTQIENETNKIPSKNIEKIANSSLRQKIQSVLNILELIEEEKLENAQHLVEDISDSKIKNLILEKIASVYLTNYDLNTALKIGLKIDSISIQQEIFKKISKEMIENGSFEKAMSLVFKISDRHECERNLDEIIQRQFFFFDETTNELIYFNIERAKKTIVHFNEEDQSLFWLKVLDIFIRYKKVNDAIMMTSNITNNELKVRALKSIYECSCSLANWKEAFTIAQMFPTEDLKYKHMHVPIAHIAFQRQDYQQALAFAENITNTVEKNALFQLISKAYLQMDQHQKSIDIALRISYFALKDEVLKEIAFKLIYRNLHHEALSLISLCSDESTKHDIYQTVTRKKRALVALDAASHVEVASSKFRKTS